MMKLYHMINFSSKIIYPSFKELACISRPDKLPRSTMPIKYSSFVNLLQWYYIFLPPWFLNFVRLKAGKYNIYQSFFIIK